MSALLGALLSFFLLAHQAMGEGDQQEQDSAANNCQPMGFGCGGIEIRYPYRLNSTPDHCGAPGMELSCDGGETALLTLPDSKSYKVTAIDYSDATVTIQLPDSLADCPLRNLSSTTNLTTAVYRPHAYWNVSLLNCSTELKPDHWELITGPVRCLGSEGHFVYAVYDGLSTNEFIPDCVLISSGGSLTVDTNDFVSWKDAMDNFIQTREVVLAWSIGSVGKACVSCETSGKICSGFNSTTKSVNCVIKKRHRHVSVSIIVGSCVLGLLVAVAAISILLYMLRRLDDEEEARLRVERFLATYNSTKPTRYTFAELKKITKRFKHRLGQGGYGSVYRGELLSGIPVAVKMLENSKGEGEEFINEVATIGRIHHINIVRLLGFCSEKSRRALVYEFMPNKSLDKYIFSHEPKEARRVPLTVEKIMDIAIGIARGIEYLHQGCDQRILHFDIKPHNILLDYEFKPKISDFGLAKLCSKDQSFVTMTAARGTRGYIAPEMYSRNFGTVSYKSDVYSFGMLLLEMIGGKKIADPETGNQIESYFPEWVYDQLVDDRASELLTREMNEKESEIMRKLATVSLWCIQWSPNERPSMSRVLQMLIGDQSHSLQIPPKPFVSSIENDDQPSERNAPGLY